MLNHLKTTIINGLLLLIPITLLLILLLKLYDILYSIAKPLDQFIPLDKIGGVTTVNLLVILLVLVICYIAGILSHGKIMKRLKGWIEDKVLSNIPGYGIIKEFTNELQTTEKASQYFKPVLVKFDDQEQLCFEIERLTNKKVVIYVPGAPSPWSGAVVYVEEKRVFTLDISVSEATKNIQRLGLESENFIQ